MLTFNGRKGVRMCNGLDRRDFLRAGALAAGGVGLSLADLPAASPIKTGEMNCILLFLVGGPSQLDTWDMKPAAPENIRGPFQPIRTNVPGVQICEHFPQMAKLADQYAIIRSVHHDEAPIHETGHQLMQTGRLFRGGQEHPHYGAVVSYLHGGRKPGMPASAVVPRPIGNTGVSISHGQRAAYLGAKHSPFCMHDAGEHSLTRSGDESINNVDASFLLNSTLLLDAVDRQQAVRDVKTALPAMNKAREDSYDLLFARNTKKAYDVAAEPEALKSSYGKNMFGQSCLLARRLVERGVRFVTVNMFDTVFNNLTWDCHADGGSLAVTLDDYKKTLCPMFDTAYSTLLTDLRQRGMLENTMVVAMGEFGRTPKLNPRGGRDHWPSVWSILFAGGGVRGGQVIGSSDKHGSEPRDRPVRPAEVAASIYHGLGVKPSMQIPGPNDQSLPLADGSPVMELF